MNKLVEVVLTVMALAGMYCAMPKSAGPAGNPMFQSGQQVLIADGSDPMPLCRGKKCGNRN
jgi:hypothetical protein